MQSSKVNELTKEDMLRVTRRTPKMGPWGSPTVRVKRKERGPVKTSEVLGAQGSGVSCKPQQGQEGPATKRTSLASAFCIMEVISDLKEDSNGTKG